MCWGSQGPSSSIGAGHSLSSLSPLLPKQGTCPLPCGCLVSAQASSMGPQQKPFSELIICTGRKAALQRGLRGASAIQHCTWRSLENAGERGERREPGYDQQPGERRRENYLSSAVQTVQNGTGGVKNPTPGANRATVA